MHAAASDMRRGQVNSLCRTSPSGGEVEYMRRDWETRSSEYRSKVSLSLDVVTSVNFRQAKEYLIHLHLDAAIVMPAATTHFMFPKCLFSLSVDCQLNKFNYPKTKHIFISFEDNHFTSPRH